MLLLPLIKHFKYFILKVYYSRGLNILNILWIGLVDIDILWVCGRVEIRNQFR